MRPPLRELFRLEVRWALLYVRGQAFLGVFALEEQLLVLALDRQSRFHRDLPASLHRALDAAHGFRSLVGRAELLGVFHDVFHEAIALENVVHDAEFLRLFERERVAGDHQLDRFALSNQPGETLRSTGTREHAKIYFRQANLAGIFTGDADVGRHGDL